MDPKDLGWLSPQDLEGINKSEDRLREYLQISMASAFNEWMRLYTENPSEFEQQWASVGKFLQEKEQGKTPSYGEKCAEYLFRLMTHPI